MKPMTRRQFHRLLTDPRTGPMLDAMLADCRACDDVLDPAALEQAKRKIDATMDALLAVRAEQLGPADGFRRAEFEAAQQEAE